MVSSKLTLVLALEAAIASAANIALQQKTQNPANRGAANVAAGAIHAAAKHGGAEFSSASTLGQAIAATVIAPETFDGGFWYANFSVGATPSVSLLIDSGSSDASVNPGLYKKTLQGKNLHKNGTLSYVTTQENGCGDADITFNEYSDVISLEGLKANSQTFANVVAETPPNSGTITVFPHQGLVGFAGADSSQIDATPFFTNLCEQGAVAACRFGLAFGTDGTGEQVLGSLDTSLYKGPLSVGPISNQWQLDTDIYVNGKVVDKDISIILDSGTANIIGPIDDVQQIFDAAGIQSVLLDLPGCTQVLTGYYPCASPPTLGFSFPSASTAANANGTTSKTSTVFNVLPAAFEEADDGSGNCTAILAGIDLGVWLLGQAFFQGKYIDHNVAGNSMGFAELK